MYCIYIKNIVFPVNRIFFVFNLQMTPPMRMKLTISINCSSVQLQEHAIRNPYSIYTSMLYEYNGKNEDIVIFVLLVLPVAEAISQEQSSPSISILPQADLSSWSAATGLVGRGAYQYPVNTAVSVISEYSLSITGIRLLKVAIPINSVAFSTIPPLTGMPTFNPSS